MRTAAARVRYYLSEALDEWRHSPGVNLLATVTLAAVLFVGGLVVVVLTNVERRLERWSTDARIEVYLRDGSSPETVAALRDRLESLPGAGRVDHVDRAEALRRLRTWYGELAEVGGDLETNPLPESLEVQPARDADPVALAGEVAAATRQAAAVEDVRYDQDLLQTMRTVLRAAGWLGAAVGTVVFGAVVFVMASVLRLAVYARRDEIEIMQLVGAAPSLIRGPFLVSGLAQGAVAALAGCALAEGARRGACMIAGCEPGTVLDLVAGTPLGPAAWGLLLAVGLGVGLVSSWFAVRSEAQKSKTM